MSISPLTADLLPCLYVFMLLLHALTLRSLSSFIVSALITVSVVIIVSLPQVSLCVCNHPYVYRLLVYDLT